MGKYLKALKKRNIIAYIHNGTLTMKVPDDGISEKLHDQIQQNLKAIKLEIMAETAESPEPVTRDNSPLMQALRAKRKQVTCPDCGELTTAQEYPQPSEGWHYYDCDDCEHCGTLCLSELSEQAQQMQAKLDAQGWCLIRSKILDEPILIVCAPDLKTPKHLDKVMRYTLLECSAMRKTTPEQVKQTHKYKRQFGGQVEKMTKREQKAMAI